MGVINNFVRRKVSEREAAKVNYNLKRMQMYMNSPELLIGNPKAIKEIKKRIAQEQRFERRLLNGAMKEIESIKNIDGLENNMNDEEAKEAEEALRRIMSENESKGISK